MSVENGGPAFPNVPDGAGDKWQSWDMGMSLRDYAAIKAMAALIAGRVDDDYSDAVVAQSAYLMADAMLKERAK